MDRSVLEGDPHAVLEGMCIAAYAIGATHGYVYIRPSIRWPSSGLNTAMAQMEEHGLLGGNIMDSGFSFDIRIKEGAGAFVCGGGNRPHRLHRGQNAACPVPRPPFPAQKGLFGKPTNINNVETLANVPRIIEKGGDWFAQFGTEKSKGTKTFALGGQSQPNRVDRSAHGDDAEAVIFEVAGNPPATSDQSGCRRRPLGRLHPRAVLDLPIDYDNLARIGSIMGSAAWW